jgi:hypothetical protein
MARALALPSDPEEAQRQRAKVIGSMRLRMDSPRESEQLARARVTVLITDTGDVSPTVLASAAQAFIEAGNVWFPSYARFRAFLNQHEADLRWRYRRVVRLAVEA